MKSIKNAGLFLIISILFLTACSKSVTSISNTPLYKDIEILTPMTISNNLIVTSDNTKKFIRIKLIRGKYYEDWNALYNSGASWEGNFNIELYDEHDNILFNTNLNKYFNNEALNFHFPFYLEFEDYNNDGNMDFTIGQYTSSNGNSYKLFTLINNEIKELNVKDHKLLFVSNKTEYYSTKFQKVNDVSFKYNYYDNSKGKSYENTLIWDNNEFVVVKVIEN